MKNNYNNACSLENMKPFILICLSVFSFLPLTNAQERKNIAGAEWLNKNLQNPHLVIIDASPSRVYSEGHIPGAVNYDLYSYGPAELPVNETAKIFQSIGISQGKKIIMYDQGGTYLATRLLFSLDYYGFPPDDLYILDGGLTKWEESGFPVTTEVPAPLKGSFTIKQLNRDVRADLAEFLEASGNPEKNALVEALNPLWHYGEISPFGRPGHVPNAILLPAEDFYHPDKTFKSNDEIMKMLQYRRMTDDKTIYTFCGGGIAASVPYFAIKYLLGWSEVKLYPGSLLEWASDARELPLWTYDAPYLMRNAGWLLGWGGKMMRMYGISNITLVDVRTTEEFRNGHLEYAINLPPDALKDNYHDKSKMKEIFSAAGIDPSAEAVIVTGGGLTKEAALAFVTLEMCGQKKVSVFMDPTEGWAGSGFNVVKDTVAVNTAKASPGTARDADYPESSGKDIIISKIDNVKRVYPEIVIATGKDIPGYTQAEKVVLISHKDLLNSAGIPKSAKDIWNILSKAGVPVYAGLVCCSRDPGEAATTYFTLRLMGFPDVKILVDR